ncbi:MAG: CO dehydrogenase/acetyl-CoA synthase complex subunit epsilon [Candidatus Thorarchaeota archaeon]|jgi:acetyl-CoA decarbonylase/synthase complex subunit epsilon
MSTNSKTGQIAEIAGPKKANIFPNTDVASLMISKAKRPLVVIGSNSLKVSTKDGDLIDSVSRLKKNPKFSVVATGHIVGEFKKRGVDDINSMSIFVLGDKLRNPDWNGFDGNGNYDVVIFVGFLYYIEWLVESGLKSFAQELRTISLDRSYQPNAEWSLGWMSEIDWKDALDRIITHLEEC